jgi:hypothetical protein
MRGSRVGRIGALAVAAVVAATALASCGSDGGQAATTTTSGVPAACKGAPLTMALTGPEGLGSTSFQVKDAVARRVAIIPQGVTFEADERSGLESQARTTPTLQYQVYLADFPLSRSAMGAASTDLVEPVSKGGTYGLLILSPERLSGIQVGSEVVDGPLGYETIQPIGRLALRVNPAEAHPFYEPAAPKGRVKVLALSDDSICLDVDVQMVVDGEAIATAKGTIEVPVVAVPPTVWLY